MLNQSINIKIFLIGMMGSGKTSVGMTLSRIMGLPFIDTDELIGCSTYFDDHSIADFRKEEAKQIDKINIDNNNSIISVGGGAILNRNNREVMSQYKCIFLKASIKNLLKRIKNQKINRPLLPLSDKGEISEKEFIDLYKKREQYYIDLADFTINTNHLSILNVSMVISEKLLGYEIIN